jgi:hypothetical protein
VTTTSFASSTGTGAGVFQTSPTITTPVINSLSSASATSLTLQSAGTTAITVSTSQNVGIGTASPTQKLQVAGNVFVSAGQYFMWDNAGAWSWQSDASTYLRAYYAGNEALRIDSSGNLLVGGTNSRGKITVEFNTNSSATPTVYFANDGGSGVFASFGSVGGTVIGTIARSGSSTAYNTSSDYRLKENIAPMTGALAKVAQLKPVTYKWKVDGVDGEGFIAHELAEVKPDCVSGTKDAVDANGNPEYQGIDVSFLVATLTAAIQELKAINDTQAETINALTARIEALENR